KLQTKPIKRVGHVFHSRYKGVLVKRQNYLLVLSRYIVLNPVRANIVSSVTHWPWISYFATVDTAKDLLV
ncbi:MAG: putative transposase, partial [Paraglaciecola sp.]